MCHELQGEGQAVNVGAVVGDDAESEDDQAELAEAAKGRKEDRSQEAADPRRLIALGVRGVNSVHGGGGHCKTEHLSEAQRDDQAAVCPGEDFPA